MTLDRSISPIIYPIHLPAIPNMEKQQLSNGIECILLPSTEEEFIRYDFIFKAGVCYHKNSMVPCFTGWMLKEGNQLLNSQEFAQKMDFYGASCTVSVSIQNSVVSLLCMRKHAKTLLTYLQAAIFHPSFPEERLKQIQVKELANFKMEKERVQLVAMQELRNAIFGQDHPYSLYKKEEDFQFERQALLDFHQAHYQTKNCSIIVSGKVDADYIKTVEELFGEENWGNENNNKVVHQDIISQKPARIHIERSASIQSGVSLGISCISSDHPDFMALRTLCTALGGYFGSRLSQSIREEKGYTYGISSGIIPREKMAYMYIKTRCKNEVVEDLIASCYEEIEDLCTNPMEDEELKAVKNNIIESYCNSLENPIYVADSFISLYTRNLDFSFMTEFGRYLDELKAEDLLATAKKYWKKENFYEVVVGHAVEKEA